MREPEAIVPLRVEPQHGKQRCGIRVRRCDPNLLRMGELLHCMLGAKRNPMIVEPDAVDQLERSLAAQRLRGTRTAAFVLGDSARDIGGDPDVDRARRGCAARTGTTPRAVVRGAVERSSRSLDGIRSLAGNAADAAGGDFGVHRALPSAQHVKVLRRGR